MSMGLPLAYPGLAPGLGLVFAYYLQDYSNPPGAIPGYGPTFTSPAVRS